jgi:ribonuclease G
VRTLALQVSPGEVWAALAQDGALIGLRLVREATADTVGAVYLGRIVALRPELPAALIDIGLVRPAFLDARDADKKRGIEGLTEGAALIVEVIKSARADKAAGVRVLRGRDDVAAAAQNAKPPARLDCAEPAMVAAAKPLLSPLPDRILVDERGALAELRRAFPERAPDLVFHCEATPLFDSLGIAEQVEALLQPRVALPGGGALFIEATHAATVIDVDSGEQAALAANLAASRLLARQIALRNLSGPIVIDFVGMRKREDRDSVAAALTTTLAADQVGADVLGWTKLGHFELVRPRRDPSLAELVFERAADGAWRKTALTLALDALRKVAREAQAAPGRRLALAVHPDIAAALDDGPGLAARQWLEARLGGKLPIAADPQRPREAVDIRAA